MPGRSDHGPAGEGNFRETHVDNLRGPIDPTSTSPPDATVLASAAITALRPDHRPRIDELGRRRLEHAAQPLVGGWTPTDLATRIGAERVDRAENLVAVLAAILRRFPPPSARAPRRQASRRTG